MAIHRNVVCACAIAILASGYGALAVAGAPPAKKETPPRKWPDVADGFASVNAMGQNGTTGGAGGYIVTVTDQAELERYAMVPDPCIIRVKGTIHIKPKTNPLTRYEKLTPKEIHVASHKTIIGVGKTGEIVNGGFFLRPGTHNVIIRNLTIRETYVEGDWAGQKTDDDGLQMDGAHHVWVDHCHFTRHGDGCIDGREGTNYVTVSWCILSKHNKTFGIGWDTEARTNYTLHHIWWRDVACRTGGGGQVLRSHVYNNYYQNVGHGPCADTGTNLVLENTLFVNVNNPHVLDQAEADKYGFCSLVATGNIYRNVRGRKDTGGKAFYNPSDFYKYSLDKTDDLPDILGNYAGPQENIGKDLPEKRNGWFKVKKQDGK